MLVTEFGDALIKTYRELERDFATMAARRLRAVIPTVSPHPTSDTKISVRANLTRGTTFVPDKRSRKRPTE
jgi:hypothetical protein